MNTKITEEEAIKVIEENTNEEDFINKHYRLMSNSEGEADDNTIELSDYWRECKSLVSEYLFNKHG